METEDVPPWDYDDVFAEIVAEYGIDIDAEVRRLVRCKSEIRKLTIKRFLRPILNTRGRFQLWEDLVPMVNSFLDVVDNVRCRAGTETLIKVQQYITGFYVERYNTKTIRLVAGNLREWTQMVRPFTLPEKGGEDGMGKRDPHTC